LDLGEAAVEVVGVGFDPGWHSVVGNALPGADAGVETLAGGTALAGLDGYPAAAWKGREGAEELFFVVDEDGRAKVAIALDVALADDVEAGVLDGADGVGEGNTEEAHGLFEAVNVVGEAKDVDLLMLGIPVAAYAFEDGGALGDGGAMDANDCGGGRYVGAIEPNGELRLTHVFSFL
jgi:hypothetical protein